MAIMYEDFLRAVHAQVLEVVAPRRRRAPRAPLRAGQRCIICDSADSTAGNYLSILASAEEGSEPWQAIRRPQRGLCLPHLVLGFHTHRSEQQRARLADAFLHGEEALRENLRELIRKHDYRFSDETMSEEERASWVHAVRRIVGEPTPRKEPPR
jgi:hypothetical protein